MTCHIRNSPKVHIVILELRCATEQTYPKCISFYWSCSMSHSKLTQSSYRPTGATTCHIRKNPPKMHIVILVLRCATEHTHPKYISFYWSCSMSHSKTHPKCTSSYWSYVSHSKTHPKCTSSYWSYDVSHSKTHPKCTSPYWSYDVSHSKTHPKCTSSYWSYDV